MGVVETLRGASEHLGVDGTKEERRQALVR